VVVMGLGGLILPNQHSRATQHRCWGGATTLYYLGGGGAVGLLLGVAQR